MIVTSEPVINKKMKQAVLRVFDDNEMLVNGKQVDLFEKEFAEYIGTRYAIATSSGTDALYVALRSLRVNKEVVTTSLSFVATPESIVLAGGIPRFTDIDSWTSCINSEQIIDLVTDKPVTNFPLVPAGIRANPQIPPELEREIPARLTERLSKLKLSA